LDFEISHTISAGVDDVAAALLDPDYQASLSDIGPLKERAVLEQSDLGNGHVRRRVRCVLALDVSGAARRFLGDSDPAWIEEAVWQPERLAWEWRIVPEVAGELLDAAGTITVTAAGEGTKRVVAGRVHVKVPFYGGKVERVVVDGLRRTYDEEAQRLAEWLAP
jgi:hypothetical protein